MQTLYKLIAKDIFSLYLMNDILMEIFPEAVANTIFKICVYLVGEGRPYILEESPNC